MPFLETTQRWKCFPGSGVVLDDLVELEVLGASLTSCRVAISSANEPSAGQIFPITPGESFTLDGKATVTLNRIHRLVRPDKNGIVEFGPVFEITPLPENGDRLLLSRREMHWDRKIGEFLKSAGLAFEDPSTGLVWGQQTGKFGEAVRFRDVRKLIRNGTLEFCGGEFYYLDEPVRSDPEPFLDAV